MWFKTLDCSLVGVERILFVILFNIVLKIFFKGKSLDFFLFVCGVLVFFLFCFRLEFLFDRVEELLEFRIFFCDE